MNGFFPLVIGPKPDEVNPLPIPTPWDREGNVVVLNWNGNVGNHPWTIRLSWVVPAGKWLLVQHMLIILSIPGTAGRVASVIQLTDSAGTFITDLFVHEVNSATPVYERFRAISSNMILSDKYGIQFQTLNTTTDTLFYRIAVIGMTFNKIY